MADNYLDKKKADGLYNKKANNLFSLSDDSNLDNDFKPFQIGGVNTGLEFKLGEIRSTAENFITAKETTQELTVTKIRGNRVGGQTEPQFLFQAPDETNPSAGLWFNCFGETGNLIRSAGTTGHLHLEADSSQYLYIGDDADNSFLWMFGDAVSGTKLMSLEHEGELKLYSTADEGDYLSIAIGSAGATTISTVDDSGTSADLTLDVDGDIILDAAGGDVSVLQADFKIPTTKKLYFDGGGDTYIEHSGADRLEITIGGDSILFMREQTTGNYADFKTTGVGFTQFEPTYNSSDTNVNFNDNGNKGFLTFGSGNITDLNLYFPNVSCNCVLLVKQDGSGSRTITNYKTFDESDGNESTVVWAGGSNPTLTTTADKLDILSFYWDNDNHKAYGVASLNF